MGQRIKRGRGSITNEFPEEIITNEILLNLPVKSLLRFKCVSKPWRALISSNRFTKDHLQISRSRDLAYRKLIYKFSGQNPNPNLWSCSVKSLLDCDNFPPIATQDHVPIGNWSRLTEILGSCDSLMLIGVDNTSDFRRGFSRGDLIVWNPSTRKLRHIPPSSYPKPRFPWPLNCRLYGFGYDDSTDDYKIVFIYSFSNTYRTEIYSLRNDSWKRIGDFEMGTPIPCPGKLVNGKLHWLAQDRRRQYTRFRDFEALGSSPWDLVALDLAKEEYEIVARLQHFSCYDNWLLRVSNVGGYLGLVCFNSRMSDIHVWSMIKYGEAESWTKIWALSEYLRGVYSIQILKDFVRV